MREFSISPDQLLGTSIRLFWSMQRHINRLRAQEDLRRLNLLLAAAVAAQGDKEFMPQVRQALLEELGSVVRRREKISNKTELQAFMQASRV